MWDAMDKAATMVPMSALPGQRGRQSLQIQEHWKLGCTMAAPSTGAPFVNTGKQHTPPMVSQLTTSLAIPTLPNPLALPRHTWATIPPWNWMSDKSYTIHIVCSGSKGTNSKGYLDETCKILKRRGKVA